MKTGWIMGSHYLVVSLLDKLEDWDTWWRQIGFNLRFLDFWRRVLFWLGGLNFWWFWFGWLHFGGRAGILGWSRGWNCRSSFGRLGLYGWLDCNCLSGLIDRRLRRLGRYWAYGFICRWNHRLACSRRINHGLGWFWLALTTSWLSWLDDGFRFWLWWPE